MESPILTKVIAPWDYRQADIFAFCKPFAVDPEALEEQLLSIRKKYAYLVEADRVQAGDIVTLRCQSEMPKFQKAQVTVCVGKNLYSRELEAKLPGMTVQEERNLEAETAQISVRILKIQRMTLPELTDEFAAEHFQTVHTLSQLRDWCINEQFEAHVKLQAEQAVDALRRQALDNSEIQVDAGERARARANGEKAVREQWALNGFALDQMTDRQAQEILGYPSAQAYIDWFADMSEEDVRLAALGYALLLAQGQAPTEERYREALRKMEQEEGIRPEQLEAYTFPVYASQLCAEHYYSVLEAYAYQKIKEKLS